MGKYAYMHTRWSVKHLENAAQTPTPIPRPTNSEFLPSGSRAERQRSASTPDASVSVHTPAQVCTFAPHLVLS